MEFNPNQDHGFHHSGSYLEMTSNSTPATTATTTVTAADPNKHEGVAQIAHNARNAQTARTARTTQTAAIENATNTRGTDGNVPTSNPTRSKPSQNTHESRHSNNIHHPSSIAISILQSNFEFYHAWTPHHFSSPELTRVDDWQKEDMKEGNTFGDSSSHSNYSKCSNHSGYSNYDGAAASLGCTAANSNSVVTENTANAGAGNGSDEKKASFGSGNAVKGASDENAANDAKAAKDTVVSNQSHINFIARPNNTFHGIGSIMISGNVSTGRNDTSAISNSSSDNSNVNHIVSGPHHHQHPHTSDTAHTAHTAHTSNAPHTAHATHATHAYPPLPIAIAPPNHGPWYQGSRPITYIKKSSHGPHLPSDLHKAHRGEGGDQKPTKAISSPLRSLLSTTVHDPLFDDEEDEDENVIACSVMAENTGRSTTSCGNDGKAQHGDNGGNGGKSKKGGCYGEKYFHSDKAVTSWVWAPDYSWNRVDGQEEQNERHGRHGRDEQCGLDNQPSSIKESNTLEDPIASSKCRHRPSKAERDLSSTLIRGRAVHEKLPLLAVVSKAFDTTDATKANRPKRAAGVAGVASDGDQTDQGRVMEISSEATPSAPVAPAQIEEDNSWLENTNLNLLFKSMEVTVRKSRTTNSGDDDDVGDGSDVNTKQESSCNDRGSNSIENEDNVCCKPSKLGSYRLYQARHPSLAPLISVTKCQTLKSVERGSNQSERFSVNHPATTSSTLSNEEEENETYESIVSVFDITPTQHRPLHEMLRSMESGDFLTQPLFPGEEGHALEPLGDEHILGNMSNVDHASGQGRRSPVESPNSNRIGSSDSDQNSKASPLAWFDFDESNNTDGGACRCRELSSQRGSLWSANMDRATMGAKSSKPRVMSDEHDKASFKQLSSLSSNFLSSLSDHQSLTSDVSALSVSSVPQMWRKLQENPLLHLSHLSRRKRPKKRFKVGTTYRADVADLRIRFIALQLFHALNFCHSRGVTLGDQLCPERIFVEEDGWIRLVVPVVCKNEIEVDSGSSSIDALASANGVNESNVENNFEKKVPDKATQDRSEVHVEFDHHPNERRAIFRRYDSSPTGHTGNPGNSKWNFSTLWKGSRGESVSDGVVHECGAKIIPYPGYGSVPTVQWQKGQITNLAYLMMINAAAGRTVGDHANPPILPWVTDFSDEINLDSGHIVWQTGKSPWRDLSKSKFRLKKGDEQLDQTFLHATPKHHIPETISDLTYTMYRARCLPIHQLRATVRHSFVPQQYPDSLAKLYDWTPDEATLEFYMHDCQPSIFRSMHNEMNDLSLPDWCKENSDCFISYHRRLLESDIISRQIHTWIDLNFGDALSGDRAVVEKNVVLHRVSWDGWQNFDEKNQDVCHGDCHSVFQDATMNTTDQVNQHNTTAVRKSVFVQIFSSPHPKKHSNLHNTISSAIHTALEDQPLESKSRVNHLNPPNESDFFVRRQRDISTVGAIIKECYCAARVIPTLEVDTAINELLMGTLDIRQSLKSYSKTPGPEYREDIIFPFPSHTRDAYDIMYKSQTLGLRRRPSNPTESDDNDCTFRSTALDRVLTLFRNISSLEALSSPSCGLTIPALLCPITSPDPFIENCKIARPYAYFAERLCEVLVSLSGKIPVILIIQKLLKFLDSTSKHSNGKNTAEALGKIYLSPSLFSSLYSFSSGERFVEILTSFISIQMSRCRDFTLQMKSVVVFFVSALAQENLIGPSICCHFLVPSLVCKIGIVSDVNQLNPIVQALKSLLPFLPEDAIGVLICKPILRNIFPVQTCHISQSIGVVTKRHQSFNSNTLKTLAFLKDLTTFLRTCLCHLESDNIVKYYFRSNASSIMQLLSTAFQASIAEFSSEQSSQFGLEHNHSKQETAVLEYGDLTSALFKEACLLVNDIIGRTEHFHFQETVLPVIETFCSQVNDEYSIIALHRSVFSGNNNSFDKAKVMALPGVEASLLFTKRIMEVCEKDIVKSHCPSAVELFAWIESLDRSDDVAKKIAFGMKGKLANHVKSNGNKAGEQTISSNHDDAASLDAMLPTQYGSIVLPPADSVFPEREESSIEMLVPKKQPLSSAIQESNHAKLTMNDSKLKQQSSSEFFVSSTHSQKQQLNDDQTESDASQVPNNNGGLSSNCFQAAGSNAEVTEKKRELAWVLGLHKQEKNSNITYSWQPRMMVATTLFKDEVAGDKENECGLHHAITCMSSNNAESLLVVGNAAGEVLLFDLRSQPPTLHKRRDFNHVHSSGETKPIRQVNFFQHKDYVLVCNGGLHIWDLNTQNIISSLSSKNAKYFHQDQTQKPWRKDEFVSFSMFPTGTETGDIPGGSSCEITAVSSHFVYTIHICMHGSVVDSYFLKPKSTSPMLSCSDPMFRSLIWFIGKTVKVQSHHASRRSDEEMYLDRPSFNLTCISLYCGGGDWICVGSSSGHIHCFDHRRRTLIICWKAHTKSVEYLKAISRCRLLSVCGDKTAIVWDMSTSPPIKIGSIYNIPGKENAMNVTAHHFPKDGLVSIPNGNFVLCAASGRKAVFQPMHLDPLSDSETKDVKAERIVMSNFDGSRISSSGKLKIHSIALLPCRQLVLLGCEGEIHACL